MSGCRQAASEKDPMRVRGSHILNLASSQARPCKNCYQAITKGLGVGRNPITLTTECCKLWVYLLCCPRWQRQTATDFATPAILDLPKRPGASRLEHWMLSTPWAVITPQPLAESIAALNHKVPM